MLDQLRGIIAAKAQLVWEAVTIQRLLDWKKRYRTFYVKELAKAKITRKANVEPIAELVDIIESASNAAKSSKNPIGG